MEKFKALIIGFSLVCLNVNAQTHQNCTEALSLFELADYEKTINFFQENQPTDYACIVLLADAYHKVSNFEKAIDLYDDAEKISKSDYQLFIKRGRAHLVNNWPEKALSDFKKAEKIFDKDEELYFFLGLAYDATGQVANAEKAYRNSLKIKSDFALSTFNLAAILAERKKMDEAKKLFENLESKDPSQQFAYHFNLGLLYYETGDESQAIKQFDQAILVQSENIHLAYLYRGLSKLNTNDIDGACNDLKFASEKEDGSLAKYYKQNCLGKKAEKLRQKMREHQYITF